MITAEVSTEEDVAQIDRLIEEFKRRGLQSAVEAFERYRTELIGGAAAARAPKKEKTISPFIYQLR